MDFKLFYKSRPFSCKLALVSSMSRTNVTGKRILLTGLVEYDTDLFLPITLVLVMLETSANLQLKGLDL